jgi:hypothetical protein
VGGQIVQVRSKNGFPVHTMTSTGGSSPQVRSKSVQNNLGGAR